MCVDVNSIAPSAQKGSAASAAVTKRLPPDHLRLAAPCRRIRSDSFAHRARSSKPVPHNGKSPQNFQNDGFHAKKPSAPHPIPIAAPSPPQAATIDHPSNPQEAPTAQPSRLQEPATSSPSPDQPMQSTRHPPTINPPPPTRQIVDAFSSNVRTALAFLTRPSFWRAYEALDPRVRLSARRAYELSQKTRSIHPSDSKSWGAPPPPHGRRRSARTVGLKDVARASRPC